MNQGQRQDRLTAVRHTTAEAPHTPRRAADDPDRARTPEKRHYRGETDPPFLEG